MMHMQELEGDPRSFDFNGRSLSKRNFQLFSITELEFAADQTVPIEPLPCRGMHLHHAPGNLRGTVERSLNGDVVLLALAESSIPPSLEVMTIERVPIDGVGLVSRKP